MRGRGKCFHFHSSRKYKFAMYIFDSLGYTYCSTKKFRECIINLFCMHNEVGTCTEIIPKLPLGDWFFSKRRYFFDSLLFIASFKHS